MRLKTAAKAVAIFSFQGILIRGILKEFHYEWAIPISRLLGLRYSVGTSELVNEHVKLVPVNW